MTTNTYGADATWDDLDAIVAEYRLDKLSALEIAGVIWELRRSGGPSMPEKPTMGMWDDFCTVFPVPFDQFEHAAKLMLDGMRRDATPEKK